MFFKKFQIYRGIYRYIQTESIRVNNENIYLQTDKNNKKKTCYVLIKYYNLKLFKTSNYWENFGQLSYQKTSSILRPFQFLNNIYFFLEKHISYNTSFSRSAGIFLS